MAETLDIHPASPEERLQCYENVYEFWPMASSLEEHLRLRLASPKHQRAHWYAGCLGGMVVASLGCFPLKYHIDGREVGGFSIGSVHTRRISASGLWGRGDGLGRARPDEARRSSQFPLFRHRSGLLRQAGLPALPFLERLGGNRSGFPRNRGTLLGLAAILSLPGPTGASKHLPRLSRNIPSGRGALARLLEIHLVEATRGRILLAERP